MTMYFFPDLNHKCFINGLGCTRYYGTVKGNLMDSCYTPFWDHLSVFCISSLFSTHLHPVISYIFSQKTFSPLIFIFDCNFTNPGDLAALHSNWRNQSSHPYTHSFVEVGVGQIGGGEAILILTPTFQTLMARCSTVFTEYYAFKNHTTGCLA